MITSESSEREMLRELHQATGELLRSLDHKRCFLTMEAMSSMSRVRSIRKVINHSWRQDDRHGD